MDNGEPVREDPKLFEEEPGREGVVGPPGHVEGMRTGDVGTETPIEQLKQPRSSRLLASIVYRETTGEKPFGGVRRTLYSKPCGREQHDDPPGASVPNAHRLATDALAVGALSVPFLTRAYER